MPKGTAAPGSTCPLSPDVPIKRFTFELFEAFVEKMNNKRNTILLFVFLLVYIGIHLYLSQYTNPIADDFSYSMKCKNSTLFHEWIGDYLTWNGRYTSNIIVFLNPLAFHSFLGYKIIPLVLFLSLFISIYGLLKNVLKVLGNILVKVVMKSLL